MKLNLPIFLLTIVITMMLIGCENNNEDFIDINTTKAISESSTVTQIAKIYADDAEYGDGFGNSISMDGDYIVVGAKYHSSINSYSGSVYLYKKDANDSIIQIAEIQPDNSGSYFGELVSISGDYIVITDQFDGNVHLYKRNSDTNVSKIANIEVNVSKYTDYSSISIDGDYIVVGVEIDDSIAKRAGSVYVFKRHSDDNVTQIAKINASDAEYHDNFGSSVSIDGNYIVVAADDEYTSEYYGSAYLFKINSDTNVSQIAKIHASDSEYAQIFGSSVSIDGDYIVVGAPGKYGVDGSVHVFKNNSDSNVSQIAKLQGEDRMFGNSVSKSGEYIVVGEKYGSSLFKINSDTNVSQIATIYIDATDDTYSFNISDKFVSMSGDYIAVSADKDSDIASRAGAAYIFKIDENKTQPNN